MNARRFVSILTLGAILLAQAPSAQAGRMHCPMKKPARAEACSRCDAAPGAESKGLIRAASCCRTAPVPATEATPLVLSARAASSYDPLPIATETAGAFSSPLDPTAAVACLLPSQGSIPARFDRTTVLRN
jgi:hypothetical protein